MRLLPVLLAGCLALPALADSPFARPFRVFVDGKPINVDIGHAAPFLADFDGDGKPDLLVGQFGQGKLWVHRNVGTRTRPRFATGTLFQAGGRAGTVPTG